MENQDTGLINQGNYRFASNCEKERSEMQGQSDRNVQQKTDVRGSCCQQKTIYTVIEIANKTLMVMV